ncbi:MAG: hypothetical protein IKU89_03540 [Oscillospiraceae bacterium]|nr:hypothetical protein [Oscillospiraceae bacterium]
MKKLDKIGKIFNIILGVTYIPLSLFSWLLQMASESTIDATNSIYIPLINAFCVICFIIPLLCIAGIIISVILRKKGYSKSSFIVQFIPLVIFILNLFLLFVTDFIPATI